MLFEAGPARSALLSNAPASFYVSPSRSRVRNGADALIDKTKKPTFRSVALNIASSLRLEGSNDGVLDLLAPASGHLKHLRYPGRGQLKAGVP